MHLMFLRTFSDGSEGAFHRAHEVIGQGIAGNGLRSEQRTNDERLTEIDDSLVIIHYVNQVAFAIDRTSLCVVVRFDRETSGAFLIAKDGKVGSFNLCALLLFALADGSDFRFCAVSFFDMSLKTLDLIIKFFYAVSNFHVAGFHFDS